MNIKDIISKINNMNLQSEEDLQEVESVLTEMDNALIEPLFRLLERHPHFNFGNPGRVVHYLEKFDDGTYAPFLYASIHRVPTEYNIWMLNRFLNSLDTSEKSEGIAILEETLQKDIDEELRECLNLNQIKHYKHNKPSIRVFVEENRLVCIKSASIRHI